jgi:glycosyltransferase involved in cell wall biosynthesis
MIKLSVAIITFNEENRIARCLESVLTSADEIIVIDSHSTDKTEDICQKYPVTFIKNPFKGHVEQKNFAFSKTNFDYVLSLDADEVLSKELQQEILKIKQNPLENAYSFNRLTNYNGHWVRFCGWYPDEKVRIVNKKFARWGGTNPHDIIILDQGIVSKKLDGDLLHYSYDSISSHIDQTNKFTTIAAKAAFGKGVRSNWFKIMTRPVLKFFRDYFYKLGFLDGKYGLIICVINGLSAFLKYSKIKELQEGQKI